jgi:alcohol dehydrogenase
MAHHALAAGRRQHHILSCADADFRCSGPPPPLFFCPPIRAMLRRMRPGAPPRPDHRNGPDMSGFVLDRIPAITQAAGALDQLGALAARLGGGTPALLVADPGLAPFGIIARAEASLRAAGLAVLAFTDIKSDPFASQVDAAAALARRGGAGVVVALGGGSAMDAGKAAAAIAPGSAPADHFALCANPLPAKPLPKICVPTTSGTGSETTRTSIVTNAAGAKVWLWGDEMKADAVLLDPGLTVGLPAHLTAATGIDALVHAVEACTNANANAGNDMFAHEAIRLVVRYLPTAVATPGDLTARAALQWAAALAGIAIDNAGTAIAHNIGHALASLRPVHHGRAVGVAMLATLPWNVAEDVEGRFATVARLLGATDAAGLPAAYERLLRGVGVKVSLAGDGFDGITPEQLAAQMGNEENAAMRRSNRRASSDADLLAFAQTVLTQA